MRLQHLGAALNSQSKLLAENVRDESRNDVRATRSQCSRMRVGCIAGSLDSLLDLEALSLRHSIWLTESPRDRDRRNPGDTCHFLDAHGFPIDPLVKPDGPSNTHDLIEGR